MNILSFDIEEWFHILDHDGTEKPKDWENFPRRLDHNVKTILDILDSKDLKASFFVLGWVGKEFPNIVKEIHKRGHEIGTHSNTHQLVYRQTPEEFNQDLKESINILTNITGEKVIYYRAPGFSIKKEQIWAFEILKENGIEIDCSIFPALRAHGGFNEFGYSEPVRIKLTSGELKAFPMNLHKILNSKFVFSGGGYFRVTPYWLLKYFSNQTDYLMTYFHPRDFDPDQPRLPGLGLIKEYKSYVGLKSSKIKLIKLLEDFKFTSLLEADKSIDWTRTNIVSLEGK